MFFQAQVCARHMLGPDGEVKTALRCRFSLQVPPGKASKAWEVLEVLWIKSGVGLKPDSRLSLRVETLDGFGRVHFGIQGDRGVGLAR